MGLTPAKFGAPSVSVTGAGTDTDFNVNYGTSAEWAAANPVLAAGEPAYATDTQTLKIGDGVTAYASLPPALGTIDGGTP